MKKTLAFALSAALLLGVSTSVFAENGNGYGNGDYNNGYEAYDSEYPQYGEYLYENDAYDVLGTLPALLPVGKVGYIVSYEDNTLVINTSLANTADYYATSTNELDALDFDFGDGIYVLHLSESTIVIDATTGLPASISDRTNDSVKIYHSPVMTMSIPPQSSALVVAVNLPEYYFSPHYHIVDSVEFLDDDTLVVISKTGLHMTLTRETSIMPHRTRQMISLDHISAGNELLVWYQMVAMSYPPQASPTHVLWLRAGETYSDIETAPDVYEYENGYYDPDYNGNDSEYEGLSYLMPGTGTVIDGIEFFPVRLAAVEAGYTVSWNNATRAAELSVNNVKISLAIGSSVFYVNGHARVLPAPAVIIDGVMYAPNRFFAYL